MAALNIEIGVVCFKIIFIAKTSMEEFAVVCAEVILTTYTMCWEMILGIHHDHQLRGNLGRVLCKGVFF